jgi:DNA-binding CsgD family transcriptional regulator/PAS domain-containing protein
MDKLFVTAVEAIYDAAADPSHWPQALQAIADCFDDAGANLLWRRDDGGFGVILSSKFNPDSAAEYHEKWWQKDIRALRSAEQMYLNPGRALTDRHLVSPEEIETHPIYTDFLARHGLRWVAGTFVSPDPHIFVTVNVQRARHKPPFRDDELAILARLGTHAEKSLRLSIRLLDSELTKIGLGEALARVGIGVFALDSLGRVVFSNPVGERLLGDGLALVNDRLLVGAAPERAALEAAIEQMTRAAPEDVAREPKPILIHRHKAERPLAVYVLPIAQSSHPAAQFLTHARSIVLAIDPEPSGPADPALVRDVLGLTLGEARMAALVGSGLSPRESADKLGITKETARTVLKRVFSKTGVSRQSELVALLTKLVLR